MALLPSFGNYSKFFNGAIGLLVGAGVTWAVSKGFGVCDVDGANCTVVGLSEAEITGIIMSLFGLLFVHQSPPNTPSPPS